MNPTPVQRTADEPADGWRDAGYTGPGCERFGEPLVVATTSELAAGGWQRAGYDSPSCRRFVQPDGVR